MLGIRPTGLPLPEETGKPPEHGGQVAAPPSTGPCYLLHPRSQPSPSAAALRGFEGPEELSRILGPSPDSGPKVSTGRLLGQGYSRRAARRRDGRTKLSTGASPGCPRPAHAQGSSPHRTHTTHSAGAGSQAVGSKQGAAGTVTSPGRHSVRPFPNFTCCSEELLEDKLSVK